MLTYRVTYTRCPTNYNTVQVLYVEANSHDDALVLAKRHIESTRGVAASEFRWEASLPDLLPEGRIVNP